MARLILDDARECQDCGLIQHLPHLADGTQASCRRCDAVLRHAREDSMNRALACALAALFLFGMGLQLPLMQIRAIGKTAHATMFSGPAELAQNGVWEISLVVLTTLVAMPTLQFFLLTYVLLGLRMRKPPPAMARLFGYVERIRPWSMIEVFLIGVFVAYTRLQAIAEVDVGPALFALGGVMLCLVAADSQLDHDAVWEALEARGLLQLRPPPEGGRLIGCDCCRLVLRAPSGWPCPRCGRRLRHRKRQSMARAWAFMAAATALYLPANIYPFITVIRFGQGEPSTIASGVVELIQYGMWPLALLVFLASITVPILKLAGISGMLLMTEHGAGQYLRARTGLYRVLVAVGRWSMIDVFMLTVLVAIVRLGFVATVRPGPGAVAFAAVVVLTMLATEAFDPRLMWDRAPEADVRAAAPHIGVENPAMEKAV